MRRTRAGIASHSAPSAGQQATQQQPGPTPAQHPPEALPCRWALQACRQGIQQPLSQSEMLAAAPFTAPRTRTGGSPQAGAEGGQAVQIAEGMKQAGTAGASRLPAPERSARRGAAQGMAHGARMGQVLAPRPGEAAMQPPSGNPSMVRGLRPWPAGSHDLAQQLQRCLSISDRDWHALKAQRNRRAAEQLAGALVLLLAEDEETSAEASPETPNPSGADPSVPGRGQSRAAAAARRQEAIERASLALAWLKGEIRDPGCPQHGR